MSKTKKRKGNKTLEKGQKTGNVSHTTEATHRCRQLSLLNKMAAGVAKFIMARRAWGGPEVRTASPPGTEATRGQSIGLPGEGAAKAAGPAGAVAEADDPAYDEASKSPSC